MDQLLAKANSAVRSDSTVADQAPDARHHTAAELVEFLRDLYGLRKSLTDREKGIPWPDISRIDKIKDYIYDQLEARVMRRGPCSSDDCKAAYASTTIDLALAKQDERHREAMKAQEERHQRAIRELREELLMRADAGRRVEQIKQQSRSTQEQCDREDMEREMQASVTQKVEEAMLKHTQAAQHDLRVIRCDILDNAHSLLEVKSTVSAIQVPMSNNSSSDLPSDVHTARGPVIPKPASPVVNNDYAEPQATPSQLSRSEVGTGFVDGSAATSDHDAVASTVSAVSDESFCVMEPNAAEVAGKKAITATTTSTSTPMASSPTLTTFQNSGPLSPSPIEIRDLIFAALACPMESGVQVIDALQWEDDCPHPEAFFDDFLLGYSGYTGDREVQTKIWNRLTAICKNAETASNMARQMATRPPLWEGGGTLGLGKGKHKSRAVQ